MVRTVVGKRTMIDEIDVCSEKKCKCRYVRFKDYNESSVDRKKNYDKICVELKKFNLRTITGKSFGISNIISGICDLRPLLKK